MTEDIINQALETVPTQVATTETPVEISPEDSQATQENAPVEPEAPDVPFPKKAINALSRRDKQIGKLQAQLAAERAELVRYREQQPKSPSNDIPKEESYNNYGEYLKAIARYEAKQEFTESQKQYQAQQTAAEVEAWTQERTQYAVTKAQDAIANIPEYKQLFIEHSDTLRELPPHIERAFFEADEPALAFFALAKEGKLESLFSMSPSRAAIEIGKAEIRGEALSKVKPVTKAPAPIQGLKGIGASGNDISAKSSAEDLLKWLNSK